MNNQTTTSILDNQALRHGGGWSLLSWRKAGLFVGLCLLMIVLLLSIGLGFFTGYVLLASEKMADRADAIVVVTGGAGRLEKAINLLELGKGKRLLISGVHPGYGPKTLERRYNLTKEQIACCVDLDSRAPQHSGQCQPDR